MTETPIQKLNSAIESYLQECGDDGLLTGWTLVWQQSTFTDDPNLLPHATAVDWVSSPSTTFETTLGLTRYLQIILDRMVDVWIGGDDD